MPLIRRQAKYKEPRLPDGLFVLVSPPGLPTDQMDPLHDEVDGPLDPDAVVVDPDGSRMYFTEGLPYSMRVVRQEGRVLWLEVPGDEGEGVREVPYRVEPWPFA